MFVNPLSLQYSLQLEKDEVIVRVGRVMSKAWSLHDLRHGFEEICMIYHMPICGMVMNLYYQTTAGNKIPIMNGDSVVTMFKDMHLAGKFDIGADLYLPTDNVVSEAGFVPQPRGVFLVIACYMKATNSVGILKDSAGNRLLRCSNCGEFGHNNRNCWRSRWCDAHGSNGSKQFFSLTEHSTPLHNITSTSPKKRVRTCSRCGKTDHNIRTCSQAPTDQ